MNQLSDLELVAQAMSTTPSQSHSPQNQTNGHSNSVSESTNNPSESTSTAAPDLSSLNLDPASVASLSSLLSLSDAELENLDDTQIEEIMKQLEAADGVADDLEGKLDKLLQTLGGVEEEIVHDKGAGEPGSEEGSGEKKQ
ncbi:uncharacterized protein IL334_003955 [Kwoniella shivajii]|uniref:Uncharacterized protein n=1 Tax=Kwoniella shivajii TaxID=564305 RepID=A0ABZ1D0C1_9TREE|nr:hypothetical protein IL334_003955 [Kwoniella shivajii]